MLLRQTAVQQLSRVTHFLQHKLCTPSMHLQQRYAGGPKTGGLPRPRFIPNPRFAGQRPTRPRRFNIKRELEPHWRRHFLSADAPSRPWLQPTAASSADTLDRSDGTREATFSGRLLEDEVVNFTDMGLDNRVIANLPSLGLLQPTPVQQAGIPVILSGHNAAIQSYTGSGKTLAYMLPVLSLAIQRAEQEFSHMTRQGRAHEAGTLQALIVAPSRELAMQIVRVGQSLLPLEAKGCVQQAIGGANPVRQVEAIQRNKPLVIVGTPGRLAEFSRNGVLLSHPCSILVLDEVDQLLSPQFREDLVRLHQHVGRRVEAGRQTLIVSATLSDKVLAQCQEWCPNAVRVRMTTEQTIEPETRSGSGALMPSWGWDSFSQGRNLEPGASGSVSGVGTGDLIPAMPPQLEHGWIGTTRRHRVDATRRAIHALNAQRALIFMNFQKRLQDTEAKLAASKMKVAILSGDLSKEQRQKVLANFRKGAYRALIVSDLMARGLDIEDCDAVINLELPSDASHYAHRAGRTGRAGRPGTVVSLVEPRERFVMDKLARRLAIDIPELKMAGGQFEYAAEAEADKSSAEEDQDWLATR